MVRKICKTCIQKDNNPAQHDVIKWREKYKETDCPSYSFPDTPVGQKYSLHINIAHWIGQIGRRDLEVSISIHVDFIKFLNDG